VLPLSLDELEGRYPLAFCRAALSCRPAVQLLAKEPFEEPHAEDTRLEEGTRRVYRVQMRGAPLALSVVFGDLMFDVEERSCFPFSRAVWKSCSGDIQLEVLTMVVDEDRGSLENALGPCVWERQVERIDLGRLGASGCMFEDGAATGAATAYDAATCDPCACVYVQAKATATVRVLQGTVEKLIVEWLVRDPLVALCRRVVATRNEPVGATDLEAAEKSLIEHIVVTAALPVAPALAPSPPLRVENIAAEEKAKVAEPPAVLSRSVSAPISVKRRAGVEGLAPELAEAIRQASPPESSAPTRPLPLLRSSSVSAASPPSPPPPAASAPIAVFPVARSPRMSLNIAYLPAPPILPDEVRASSPRSSQVLPGPPPVALTAPRSPRASIPLSRKSANDVRAPHSPRSGPSLSQSSGPRSATRPMPDAPPVSSSVASGVAPPPPPPPPPPADSLSPRRSPRSSAATLPAGAAQPDGAALVSPRLSFAAPKFSSSPRARSSTVLEEDLQAQAQRLRASPPPSPRLAAGNDMMDTLMKKIGTVRSAVHREEDDANDDDDW
jgi:hypothetical protein